VSLGTDPANVKAPPWLINPEKTIPEPSDAITAPVNNPLNCKVRLEIPPEQVAQALDAGQ